MLGRAGLVAVALTVLVGVAPATVSATSGYCGIAWGSTAKSASPTTSAELVGLRAGRHDCYDRLVFDLRGPVDGYWVSYVDEVTHDPTGNPVPLRGGAKLQVTVQAPAYDESGTPTYVYPNPAELVNVTGFQTFRQVAWAGSFEGTTSVGLGVRARLPFRVLTLPDRVVVDVAHLW
ncbi:MAG TPA: hypothetical protein VGR06_41030 [Actinophytocola sp.]|uniref:AMIN-like domain-containing (lipo)protein n=1 Tax=Actinophytocola sp. TaxID=1872138 RepID=UPI002E0A98C4|nr:hypothetical protein [Actinophytocola sp.]